MSQPRSAFALQHPDADHDDVPENRTELVRSYANIVLELHREEDRLVNSQSPRILTQRLEEQNRLFAQVKTASTMVQDCEAVRRIVKITASQVAAVNFSPKSINLQNVRMSLVRKFGGGVLNLEQLGEWSLRKSRVPGTATPFLFGLGEFQPIQRMRSQHPRAQKDAVNAPRAVDQSELSTGRANQLLTRARDLYDKLKRAGSMPLATVIAAPVGFAQTIQNAFDLSHLVRDGKVGLKLVGTCVVATADVKHLQPGAKRHPCILHLCQSDYQKYIEDPEMKEKLLGGNH
jgi:hypothetical protein